MRFHEKYDILSPTKPKRQIEMGFADNLKKLDAQRLQQSVKATVQFNGRLSFTIEAGKVMGLSEEKSIIIYEAGNGDLGATISVKDDPDGFTLKKCGPYYYIAFRNYLQQAGIDYKKQKIIFDITLLDEKIEGRTLFKFERRVLPRDPKDVIPSEQLVEDDDDGNTPEPETAEPARQKETAQ